MIRLSSVIKNAVAALFAAAAVLCSVTASAIPARPEPPRLVNDLAGIMTPDQVDVLEQRLVAYSDSTTTQIAVLVVNDLEGEDASSYAIKTHESWGIGSAGNDNGVLILVKPKNDNGSGEVFISVGYGLEGAIPDARAKRIINEIMIPHFIENDYHGAIEGACDKIIRLADDEDFSSEDTEENSGIWSGAVMLLLFILLVVFLMRRGSNNGGGAGTTGNSGTSTDNPGPVYTGPISRGGSSFGGGSIGGGFGGFGGGSTGGAGAGGKW